MKPTFESSKLLVSRAKSHLAELEAAVAAFSKQKPYTKFIEKNHKTGRTLHKARFDREPPPELAAIIFDAVNCLRSSLDHAVFDAARSLGKKPKPKYTKFPFGPTKADASKDLKRKTSEVPIEITKFCLRFKPYRRGNKTLWALNEIRNGKIHQTLEPTLTAAQGVSFSPTSFGGAFSIGELSTRRWDRRKQELTYMDSISSGYVHLNTDITAGVSFSGNTPFPGMDAIAELNKCFGVVEGIVLGIEAETTRIIAARA